MEEKYKILINLLIVIIVFFCLELLAEYQSRLVVNNS